MKQSSVFVSNAWIWYSRENIIVKFVLTKKKRCLIIIDYSFVGRNQSFIDSPLTKMQTYFSRCFLTAWEMLRLKYATQWLWTLQTLTLSLIEMRRRRKKVRNEFAKFLRQSMYWQGWGYSLAAWWNSDRWLEYWQ